jgi:hypothetical protein
MMLGDLFKWELTLANSEKGSHMSEDKDKAEKIARITIKSLTLDPIKKTCNFDASMTGKIRDGDLWTINPATTSIKGTEVPVEDLLSRVLQGWFWVRKVQDTLRKGTKVEAEAQLAKGYDWADTTSRRAPVALTPEGHATKIADNVKSLAELNAAIAILMKKAQELEGIESNE